MAEQLAFTERVLPQVVADRTKSDALAPPMETPLMVIGAVFPFDRVMDCDAVLVPNAVLPKARADGLAATTPLVPRPERATACGLLLSESLKFRIAVRVPVAAGPKMIFTVQVAAGARVVPQVLLKMEKSPGFVPLKLMLLMLMAAPFPFVRMTAFCPLLLPMATAAQVRLEGETELAPVDDPEPERATIWGLLVAESTKLRLAVRAPVAAGVKTMLTVHAAEMAREAPHVLPVTRKSDALAPDTDTLLIEIDEPGPFKKVTVWAALLVPTLAPGKERLAGDTDAVAGAAPPTPESVTAWGLPDAESVKLRLAVRVPVAPGLKTRVAVQLAPTDRLAAHVEPERTKSDGLVPVTATPLMASGDVLPFESVTD